MTRTIRKAHRRGKSYEAIGKELGVSKAEARRLALGKYPGETIAAKIGLPVICHTCKRRVPGPRKPRTVNTKPSLKQSHTRLLHVCKMALDAFEKNHAINWDELAYTIKEAEKI